jgi:hypothetical protein
MDIVIKSMEISNIQFFFRYASREYQAVTVCEDLVDVEGGFYSFRSHHLHSRLSNTHTIAL